MTADESGWWGPKEDKRETVKFHLGRIGISLDVPGDQLPAASSTAKPLPPISATWPDAFLPALEGRLISTTLAGKLHYRPAPPAAGAGPGDVAASEEQGYEDMRR